MDHVNKILDTLDEYTEVIEVFKDATIFSAAIALTGTIPQRAVAFFIRAAATGDCRALRNIARCRR